MSGSFAIISMENESGDYNNNNVPEQFNKINENSEMYDEITLLEHDDESAMISNPQET